MASFALRPRPLNMPSFSLTLTKELHMPKVASSFTLCLIPTLLSLSVTMTSLSLRVMAHLLVFALPPLLIFT